MKNSPWTIPNQKGCFPEISGKILTSADLPLEKAPNTEKHTKKMIPINWCYHENVCWACLSVVKINQPLFTCQSYSIALFNASQEL